MDKHEMDELDCVLDVERSALLAGDLEKLSRLVTVKEDLVTRLQAAEVGNTNLAESISYKLARNQELLDQARSGVQSVSDRLSALKRVHESLDTYDANGEKQTVTIGGHASVEKRA